MESVIVFLWLMWRCWKVFFLLERCFLGWMCLMPNLFPTYTQAPIVPPPRLPLPWALLEDHMGHLPAQQWRVFEEPKKNRYPPAFKHSHEKSTICKSVYYWKGGISIAMLDYRSVTKKNTHGEKKIFGELWGMSVVSFPLGGLTFF